MTARRLVFLTCNGTENLGGPCIAMTLDDLFVAGATPSTVAEARSHPRANGWHRTRDGRDLCPDCWAEGQR